MFRKYYDVLGVLGYGHIAPVCRREMPKREKCAGGHETKECVISVKKVMCVRGGGDQGAGDQRCPVRERQIEVARATQKVSYAEAVERGRGRWVQGEGSCEDVCE